MSIVFNPLYIAIHLGVNKLMMCFKKTAIIVSLFLPVICFSQLPGPATLGVGLNAVTGNKGMIDTEILVDIILEKQAEIKNELIKKGVSKLLQKENYALWEFGYLTTRALLEGNNKEIITQKILEQSTNLLLVYQFAEYGLKVKPIEDILVQIETTKRIGNDKLKMNMLSDNIKNMYVDLVYDVLIHNKSVTNQLGLFSNRLPFGLSFYQHVSKYKIIKSKNPKTIEDSIIISCFDEIHELLDKRVTFYLNNYYLLKQVTQQNGEYAIQSSIAKQMSDFQTVRKDEKKVSDHDMLKSTFDKNMKNLSKTHENKPNYAAYNKAVDISELTKDSVTVLNSNRNKLADKNSEIAQSYLKDSLIEEYKKFKIAIRGLLAPKTNVVQNVLVNNASVPDESIFDDLTKMLSEIDGFVGRVMQNPTDVFQNDLYYIQQKVKPMIGKLVVVAELDSKYLDEVKKTEIALTAILTHQLNDSLLSEFSENTLLSSENSVIGTINKLSDLDDPVFYQSILANLKTELIEFFEKDTASKGLKVMLSLLSNIDLNTLTNVANKTLEIDVEEIIIWMYDTFIDKVVDGGGRISPYFTIGLNYSNLKPIDLDESDKINQFSYASEKIGFAWKIIDVKHKRATKDFRKFTYTDFCTGKKKTKTKVLSPEPIISNIHLLSYASGLLYTLVDATTEEEFDSPLAAVGVGLTFFNSLELNFSHVWPLDSDRSPTYPRFFQVSFDVKIVDYLSAARKKRLNLKGK